MKTPTTSIYLIALSFFLIAGALRLNAQTVHYAIPKEYTIAIGSDDRKMEVTADIDGDSITDFFAIVNSGETVRIISFNSSNFKSTGKPRIYDVGDFACCSFIEIRNRVISIHSTGNSYFSHYKLRYNSNYGDFEIIGFDDESFGNAVHDESGSSSYNFLTGVFEVKAFHYDERKKDLVEKPLKTRRIKPAKKYFLSHFKEAIAFIDIARPS